LFASGSLVDPDQAAAAVVTGQADACEMTRALIADPDLPRRLAEHRPDAVRPCIRCNQDCAVRSAANAAVSCVHNPEAGHEADFPAVVPAAAARHVVVVGGGPAGLEAALTAVCRGHRVTLLERAEAVGGTPRAVVEAGQRLPFGQVSAWRSARLAEREADVRVGVEATPALVAELGPDAVIVATGARPRPPEGLAGDLTFVVSLRDALAGRLPGSGRVVVLDRQGGHPAIDAARAAAAAGRPVTIVSEDPFVSSQLGATGELSPWYREAAALGIDLRPMTVVTEITPDAVRLRHRFGPAADELPAACVVLADHELPDDALYHAMTAALPGVEVRRVGDCVAPRRVLHAVLEGGRAGREV
jgi:2,4-dienoyl-CoA reductase (NADPH2)